MEIADVCEASALIYKTTWNHTQGDGTLHFAWLFRMSFTFGVLFILPAWLAVRGINSKRFMKTRTGIMKTLF